MAGVRERVRAEVTAEILTVARRHLAEQGAAALSLRAVARDVGMVSSAIYRYFASRDELLTALIVEAYDAVGDVAERADAECQRDEYLDRWLEVAKAIRSWARANVQQYALVYGTPVPGYQAPQDTVDPAARVVEVVTGGWVRRTLSDTQTELAVAAMSSCFKNGDLAGGLHQGIRLLAEHAKAPNTLHQKA